MVSIEIHNARSRIVGQLDDRVLSKLNGKLSYELPGAYYAQQINPYAGVRHLFAKGGQSFPTGLIHYVEEVLQKCNVSYEIVDLRVAPTLGKPLDLHGFGLRDYQDNAATLAVERQRGIIKVGTGGGKTNILTAVVAKTNLKTLILIHKTDIFYQLVERLEKGLKIPIGKIGDGQFDIQNVTVAMIQTLARAYGFGNQSKKSKKDPDYKIIQEKSQQMRDLVASVECLLTDEAHHTPSDIFWEVHKNAQNAYYKIGFSASPWREDNADMLIEAAHARQIVDVSASTLIERGYLVKPKVFLYTFPHAKTYVKGTKYAQIYDGEVVQHVTRNSTIAALALKASSEGRTVLIAVTKIEHGKTLEAVLQKYDPSAIFVSGESETELRQTILKELDQHKRKIVICTTIFGEGIDCPGLDVLINAKAAASSVDAFQLIGRVLRLSPGKKQAYVVDIFDEKCKYLGGHSTARLKIYQTEPLYELIPVDQVDQVDFKETSNG